MQKLHWGGIIMGMKKNVEPLIKITGELPELIVTQPTEIGARPKEKAPEETFEVVETPSPRLTDPFNHEVEIE